MGEYFASLESKIFLYTTNYLNAYNMERYLTAAKHLYSLNTVHPSKAFLKDMPRFTVRSNSLTAILDEQAKAKRYCDYWHDLLEIAMTDFREENQMNYNRV